LRKSALFSNTHSPAKIKTKKRQKKKEKDENIPFKSITELEGEKCKRLQSTVTVPSGNTEKNPTR